MTLPFVNSTPVIQLEGTTHASLVETLLSLLVEETMDGPATCQARFLNWSPVEGQMDFLYFDRTIFDFGKKLNVLIPDVQGTARIFSGRISALEALFPTGSPPEILVYAEDQLQGMRTPRRLRLFHFISIPELIQRIAAEHGLDVQAELHSSYASLPVIAQFEQSDLTFILESARRASLDIWLSGDRLMMRDRRSAEDEIELSYGQGLLSFEVRADLADQLNSLSVTGWDVQTKQVVEASASAGAIQDELDGRQGSSQYLESFAARHERLPASLAQDVREAEVLAKAALRERARRFVSGVAVAQGNPHPRLGGYVHFQGLGPLFSGAYFIEKVRHLYDRQSGYRTELQVSRPGLEQAHRSPRPTHKPKGKVQKRTPKAGPPSKKPGGRKLEA